MARASQTLELSAKDLAPLGESNLEKIHVRDAAGKELLSPQEVSATRTYSFDERRLLAKGHEEDILRQDMARDLAELVMRRLSRL